MIEPDIKVAPVSIDVESILLRRCHADRDYAVEFEAPGKVSITYVVDEAEYDDDSYWLNSSYEILLSNKDDEPVARLGSTFHVMFKSDADTQEMTDEAVIKGLHMAASEAVHPYHRDLIISMSERFDIPTYRLGYTFDEKGFAAGLVLADASPAEVV